VTVEDPAQAALWSDLGTRWRLLEQYVKPFPVCRWAQPAIEAADHLVRRHALAPGRIARVEVRTFAEGVRLGTAPPATTEAAQYALGFPLAAHLARGRLGAAEIGPGLSDPAVAAMLARIVLVEEPAFSRRFPAERLASVAITLADGAVLESGPVPARGDPDRPLAEAEIRAKFDALAAGLPSARRAAIAAAVEGLDAAGAPARDLIEALLAPVGDERSERAGDAGPAGP
jgi:2-methylcitrate dehydratase PrpD